MANLPMRRIAEHSFWRLIWVMLALGLVAEVISCSISRQDLPSWTDWTLGMCLWVGALALCALLLKLVSNWSDLLRVIAAMWRPLVLVIAAAYLLFSNDQGRELGVSLMEEHSGWRLFFLFLALIYWATNNWHTARLGLRAAVNRQELPAPSGNEKWLFWPPRLLGVCAHLFAAVNLSLAAQNQPAFASSGLLWLVAWTAPLIIIIATGLAWHFDRLVVSQRTSRERTTLTWVAGAIVALLLLAGIPGSIVGIAFFVGSLPPGFSWGTFSISASAVVFLIGVSWLRRRPLVAGSTEAERAADDKRENLEIFVFTAGLILIAFVFACATWINAVAVGRSLGSMVVAYFALGAILALVNAGEFALAWMTEKGLFGHGARPRVVGAFAVIFMIGLGVINAWLHPFHRVRLCDGGDCVPPLLAADYSTLKSPDERPTVKAAARVWYEQAKAAYGKAHGDGPVPMLIVATAGGGIRAAYWTAEALEKLAGDFTTEDGFKDEGGVRPYLFAISGVSGGSVGAVAFEAALAERDELQCHAGDPKCPLATTFLTADFLAPALANMVFVDAPSSFLPDFGQVDRGTALERSFEDASDGRLARPFLSLFPFKKDPAVEGKAPWRPILLLNATHEETGKRIITGHVLIERNVFIDSLDTLHVLTKDVRASTAAHNSARFTYISPAGNLGDHQGSVIDGGYFENYGALSALELARAARSELGEEKPGIKLVFLMISSDPGLEQANELVRIKEAKDHGPCLVSVAEREGAPSGAAGASQKPDKSPNYLSLNEEEVQNALLNEFLAPFQGIKNVREAHGNRAAAEIAVQICTEYPSMSTPAPAPNTALPSSVASQSLQKQGDILDKAKNESVDQSPYVEARDKLPYFAHLAMCTKGDPPPVQAPLGWVLSTPTQAAFQDLLCQCGNGTELEQLEIALGKTNKSLQACSSNARKRS
ncbi:hypothetical protein [Rhizobium ruizarguesonis]|uniref:hypothetical protein n=1 Tax=Rhizobium ruizarguesonis TaxID=2081791 RepID=UPI001030E176|nr:hypothetical protein [Rhizobium ruizarguesonis]TBA29354.1 hypothetical protein ELH63_37035 [Rhizobium ruizarguesonis]TBA31365.1 hypothetical protein ELH62_32605 [Rhizobium ruizarguesonis]